MSTTITFQLEILPGDRIIVPGCEPTSYVSSRSLSYAYKNQLMCGTGYVDLKTALTAIPGSYVKIGLDWAKGQKPARFYCFPAESRDCPCNSTTDWYALLKALAIEDQTIQEQYDYCNVNEQGFCPSPDFNAIPAPEQSPYLSEDQAAQLMGGILPPIPPWQIK